MLSHKEGWDVRAIRKKLGEWLLAALAVAASCGMVGCGNGGGTLPPPAPTLTAEPQNVSVPEGSTATFTAAATSPDGSALSYQWLKNGNALPGTDAPSYTTPATTLADAGGRYSVKVSTAKGGSVTSREATLAVTAVAPGIASAPADVSVAAGASAGFSVTASGSAPISYQWLRDGTPIDGATGSHYELDPAQLADDGAHFSVTVTNAAGSATSREALLSVTPVVVPAQVLVPPASLSVSEGTTATFSVSAGGTTPLAYQWQRNGANIAGATAASYTTPPTVLADSGARYAVVVSNGAASATSAEATLTVLPALPVITRQPAGTSVVAGSAASFSVEATGSGTLAYQWQRGGVAIAGATAASYTLPATTLADDGAGFSVVVSNAGGSVTSAVATLVVTSAPQPPTIATAPQPQTVAAGQTASFSVVAGGTPPFTYQWQRDGVAIAGATGDSYTTPATVLADSGAAFRVVVSNSAGSVTSSATTLTVNAAGPTITAQPQGSSVLVGRPVTFGVSAVASSGSLSYQWRRNGADIAGETGPSYTLLQSTFADDGGVFSVLVRDARGSVVSNGATLRVTPIGVEHVTWAQRGLVSRNVDGSVWLNWDAPGTTATTRVWTPVLLRDAGGFVRTGFSQVTAGQNHALAIDEAGAAWAWGYNDYGKLGNGSTIANEILLPAPMQAADGSPLTGVVAVAAASIGSYALMETGTLNAFGWGGDIGIGAANTMSPRATPVRTGPGVALTEVSRVVTHPSASHAMALRTDGTLWAWGRPGCINNVSGCLLGDGATNFSDYARQVRLANGTAITSPRAMALEKSHSVVVQSDGTVLAWGLNAAGQLGDGTTTPRGNATLVRTAAGGVFDNVVDVAAAYNVASGGVTSGCTVFLRADGSVWATGDNTYGCIGDASSVNRTTPVPVLDDTGTPLTGVTELFGSWDGVIVAKKSDGSFWAWGRLRYGDDTSIQRTAQRLTFFAP